VESEAVPNLIRLEQWVNGSQHDFWGGTNSDYDSNVGINWEANICPWGSTLEQSQNCTLVYTNPKQDIQTVVVHHGGKGGTSGLNPNNGGEYFNRAMNWHLSPLNDDSDGLTVCYHFGIDANGTTYEGRPIRIRGCHVSGANTGKLGVLIFGDFNLLAGPTTNQVDGTVKLISGLKSAGYSLTSLAPHRALSDSDCPGINFGDDILQDIANRTGVQLELK
jgi:hypothetical protein